MEATTRTATSATVVEPSKSQVLSQVVVVGFAAGTAVAVVFVAMVVAVAVVAAAAEAKSVVTLRTEQL